MGQYDFKYPPLPSRKIPIELEDLKKLDINQYIAQPEMNGKCAVIVFHYAYGYSILDRHGNIMRNVNNASYSNLFVGKYQMILVGAMMNKGTEMKGFVIWDILEYNGEKLLDKTVKERVLLLDSLYGKKRCSKVPFLTEVTEGVRRVKSYQDGFSYLYDDIASWDSEEKAPVHGIVLKEAEALWNMGGRNDWLFSIGVKK